MPWELTATLLAPALSMPYTFGHAQPSQSNAMTEITPALASIYDGWATYQGRLTKAIAPLTSAQLALSAASDLRPIWILAAHIIAARVWWFHEILGEGSRDLGPLVTWDDDGQPARSAVELTDGLDRTWQLVYGCVHTWRPTDLVETVRREVRGKERTYTRQWVIWHVLEHDLHHGGEISYSLGMHGLTGLDV